jgi:hypothetical protein
VAIRNGIESGRSAGAPSGPAPAAASTGDLGEVLKQLTRTRKKVESVEESLQNRLSVVANEVSIKKINPVKIASESYMLLNS